MLQRCKFYIQLMRLDKPVGIFLLLLPTLTALYMAVIEHNFTHNIKYAHNAIWQNIDVRLWCIFTLSCICMRSAGCAINDYFDKNFDAHVERTKNRPLALQPHLAKHALYLSLCLLILCVLLTYFFLNIQTLIWGIFASILAATYPLFKRFFSTPQAYLGIAFSMGIPMAYVAQNAALTWVTLALFIANILLVFAYDTAYAMVDQTDDIKIGIRTAAIYLGKYAPSCILVCTFIYWCIYAYIGYVYKASILFWLICILGSLKIVFYDYKKLYSSNTLAYFNVFKSYQYVVFLSFIAVLLI
jgi:4-hydroxybenzoate polyprenyltransferase